MKFIIATEHINFFQKHQNVELEGFFTAAQLKDLQSVIHESIATQVNIPVEKFVNLSTEKTFALGHDLWRRNPRVRKFVFNPSLASIVASLLNVRQVRLGYDQFLPARTSLINASEPLSLQDGLSFQGALCCMIVALSDSSSLPEGSPLPSKAGNVSFIHAEAPIDFQALKSADADVLVVLYVQATTLYIKQPLDPHLHALRELGYAFGDRLRDDLHPIVYRE